LSLALLAVLNTSDPLSTLIVATQWRSLPAFAWQATSKTFGAVNKLLFEMDRQLNKIYSQSPRLGCVLALVVMVMMCVWPFVLIEGMQLALNKLHLHPALGFLVVLGILAGSFVNVPLHRIDRKVEQVVLGSGWRGWFGQVPIVQRTQTQTIIAINVGGCVIPLLLALFELTQIIVVASGVVWALGIAVVVTVVVCFLAARPIRGVGIAMPALLPPAVAVGTTWLLLMHDDYSDVRAPVAFIAGIAGPLVGADLLHLREFSKVSIGVLSIGGAGTFDGIVLSGMMAALLA